jgi:hypothetical protein
MPGETRRLEQPPLAELRDMHSVDVASQRPQRRINRVVGAVLGIRPGVIVLSPKCPCQILHHCKGHFSAVALLLGGLCRTASGPARSRRRGRYRFMDPTARSKEGLFDVGSGLAYPMSARFVAEDRILSQAEIDKFLPHLGLVLVKEEKN